MGQLTPITNSLIPARHYFVGKDREGHWIVRDKASLCGGLFISKSAAIRFACFETDR